MSNDANYERIKEALEYIVANFRQQPHLEQVAEHLHLSEFHFQRLFKEWAGISPKKFLQYITLDELKRAIEGSSNIASLTEEVGLSSPSRVYDLFVQIESVTPQEYKLRGKGVEITYGLHSTPFGRCLIANTSRGICAIEFTGDQSDTSITNLKNKWINANFRESQLETMEVADAIFGRNEMPAKALLFGTPFQVKVWEALLKIPYGKLTTYSSIAEMVGNPTASRAVGTAIGCNNIAYLIPCHRVIQRVGGIGGYKWGEERKLAMIGYERCCLNGDTI